MTSPLLRLAWKSLMHHKVRSFVLVLCIGLLGVLPLAVEGFLQLYRTQLESRAVATPLVVGAPGSRSDLLIQSLYFRGSVEGSIPMRIARQVAEAGRVTPIPLHIEGTVRDYPLVGTSPDYQKFRNLRMATGGPWPQRLSEAVIGSKFARREGLTAGDTVPTDAEELYDLGGGYPLVLKIRGVLEPTGTPDDEAVFVSLQTSWVVDGEGHGHIAINPDVDFSLILENKSDNVTMNAAIVEAVEVTPENENSFHFHGDPDDLPISSLLIDAATTKDRTLARSNLRRDEELLVLDSMSELNELLGIVLQAKAILDANSLLVLLAALLMLGLIVTLDIKVREREVRTLERIGAPRGFVARLLFTEVAIVVGSGAILALITARALIAGFAGGWLSF
ncbi:MAG: ABC transporter permease [Planctomycetes bacterium]|nr:ABC transporter permease [Planctomycetota bacterium]